MPETIPRETQVSPLHQTLLLRLNQPLIGYKRPIYHNGRLRVPDLSGGRRGFDPLTIYFRRLTGWYPMLQNGYLNGGFLPGKERRTTVQ